MTFLHVFHHSVLPWSWWWGIKIAPGEQRRALEKRVAAGSGGSFPDRLLSHLRRNGLFPCHDKLLCTRYHVLLLRIVCPGPCGSALPLVEETYDSHSAGEEPVGLKPTTIS